MHVVLELLSNGEGLNRFLQHVLPKLSKITLTCPKTVKGPIRVNSDLPKDSKRKINFELLKVSRMTILKIYTSSHGEARTIKFGHLINTIEIVLLGTLPQAGVMSLAHNHLTNLFISSNRGAAVIKFGQ